MEGDKKGVIVPFDISSVGRAVHDDRPANGRLLRIIVSACYPAIREGAESSARVSE